jgi:hypothetical protein
LPKRRARADHRVDDGGAFLAPVFPREEVIDVAPAAGAVGAFARQCQIADGDDTRAFAGLEFVAAAIAEGVELLDVAERHLRLFLHQIAQADFERAVAFGFERAEGETVGSVCLGHRIAADDENARHVVGHCDDASVQADDDRVGGFGCVAVNGCSSS